MRNYLFSYKFLVVFLLSIGAFTSCITSKKINYLQEPSHTIPRYNDSVTYSEYKLNKGDRLYVRLLCTNTDAKLAMLFNGGRNNVQISTQGSETLDLYTYKVQDDGTVQLPVVGNVRVFGKTLREAKKIMESAITPLFTDQFALNVNIVERYFSIIGSQINGKYPITKEKMTIFQALAMAGDIDVYGDRSKIKIMREVNGTMQIKAFDVRSKTIIHSEYYYVQPNDVIYIQNVKQQFFAVTSFGAALATFFSTFSFGLLIYNLSVPKSN